MENWFKLIASWGTVGLSGGVGFYALRWTLEWFGARADRRAEAIDAGTQQIILNLREEVNRMIEQGNRDRARITAVEAALDECKEKHADAELRVKKLEGLLQGIGDARQYAQLIVSDEKSNGAD